MTTQSTSELLGALAKKTGVLVRQEVELARTEMTDKAREAARDSLWLVVGGALGLAATLALVAALIAGLAEAMPVWLAALVVGVVLAALAYGLVQRGVRALGGIDVTPKQTAATLRELVPSAPKISAAKEQP